MTQTEQTTKERIEDYLERTVYWDNNHGDMEGYDEASQNIAAEIDGLAAQLAEARLGRERVLSWFAWLIGGWNATQGEHTGRLRFDGVDYDNDEAIVRHLLSTVRADDQKKLAEARAQTERLGMACGMAYCLAGKVEVDPSRPVEKMQEIIAAVEAQIAALTPKAEAWDALEAWRSVGMHIENRRGRDDAYQEMDRAAARAREVKP